MWEGVLEKGHDAYVLRAVQWFFLKTFSFYLFMRGLVSTTPEDECNISAASSPHAGERRRREKGCWNKNNATLSETTIVYIPNHF
jgi:hypothetical protein